jgi:hypothetical protein
LFFILLIGLATAGQITKEVKVGSASSRQVADKPAAYLGPFRINGEKPKGFEHFDYFILGYKEQADADRDNREALLPDARGVVAVRGQLGTIKGNLLDFEAVRLVEFGPVSEFFKGTLLSRVIRAQPVALSFTTVERKGFKYAFKGEYLDDPVEENGGYTYLKGALSKFRNGKLVAEAKVGFARIAYQELLDGEQ